MTATWLAALFESDEPAILVTVAKAEGSVPREAGAKMVVTASRAFDTIGGGHLEFMACEQARAMLAAPASPPHLQRFALGPTLGQCCGGAVTLCFELATRVLRDEFFSISSRLASGQSSWRLTQLGERTTGAGPQLDVSSVLALDAMPAARACADFAASHLQPTTASAPAPWPGLQTTRSCHTFTDAQGRAWLADIFAPPAAHLLLFGAGHVGAAIVTAMAALPCRITWIDEREAMRPPKLPDNVGFEATDTPEALIDQAGAGASYLVMTHSHPLDQQLCERILRRGDFGWFGLIGSRTKRVSFERRLLARGIARSVLDRMCCPIGLPGIEGKEPAVIAVAVAAQLLQAWQMQLSRQSPAGLNEPYAPAGAATLALNRRHGA